MQRQKRISDICLKRRGITLLELLACVTILSVLVLAIVPRLGGGSSIAKESSCQVNKQVVEVQSALWKRAKGSWPSSDLSDVGRDTKYFPEGVPVCPVDGTKYRVDSTGVVQGHNH